MKFPDKLLLMALAEIEGYLVIGEADEFLHVKNQKTRWFRYNPLQFEDQALSLLRLLLENGMQPTLRYDAATHDFVISIVGPEAFSVIADPSLKRAICRAADLIQHSAADCTAE